MFYIVFDFGMLVIFIALEVYFYYFQGKTISCGHRLLDGLRNMGTFVCPAAGGVH